MYPRIYIGKMAFSTYWTVFLVGLIMMLLLNQLRSREKQQTHIKGFLLTLYVVFLSLLGAKILYYLENPYLFLSGRIGLDGVSFFGSLFLVPLGMILFCRVSGDSYQKVLDYLSPSLMLMLGVLRIGCFVSGCCGGIAVTFGSIHISKFPTQLTECVFDLMIMLGLLLYDYFWMNDGRLYPFIMVYYGCLRFFLEFVRDTPKDWLYLSHGQWYSIVSVVIGGYWLYRLGEIEKRERSAYIKQKLGLN